MIKYLLGKWERVCLEPLNVMQLGALACEGKIFQAIHNHSRTSLHLHHGQEDFWKEKKNVPVSSLCI